MSKSKRIVIPLVVIFLLTLIPSEKAFSAATEQRPEPHLFVYSWTWLNPLEFVSYKMYQYADGTIVAMRTAGNAGTIFTIDPGEAYEGRRYQPDAPPGSQHYIGPPQPDYVYKKWKERRLRCEVMRTTPDLFGVPFKSCQVAPFGYVYGRDRVKSTRGEVWVLSPPRSGKQEMPGRGNTPGWGN